MRAVPGVVDVSSRVRYETDDVDVMLVGAVAAPVASRPARRGCAHSGRPGDRARRHPARRTPSAGSTLASRPVRPAIAARRRGRFRRARGQGPRVDVALVVGRDEPRHDGVADYVHRLADALPAHGVQPRVVEAGGPGRRRGARARPAAPGPGARAGRPVRVRVLPGGRPAARPGARAARDDAARVRLVVLAQGGAGRGLGPAGAARPVGPRDAAGSRRAAPRVARDHARPRRGRPRPDGRRRPGWSRSGPTSSASRPTGHATRGGTAWPSAEPGRRLLRLRPPRQGACAGCCAPSGRCARARTPALRLVVAGGFESPGAARAGGPRLRGRDPRGHRRARARAGGRPSPAGCPPRRSRRCCRRPTSPRCRSPRA